MGAQHSAACILFLNTDYEYIFRFCHFCKPKENYFVSSKLDCSFNIHIGLLHFFWWIIHFLCQFSIWKRFLVFSLLKNVLYWLFKIHLFFLREKEIQTDRHRDRDPRQGLATARSSRQPPSQHGGLLKYLKPGAGHWFGGKAQCSVWMNHERRL